MQDCYLCGHIVNCLLKKKSIYLYTQPKQKYWADWGIPKQNCFISGIRKVSRKESDDCTPKGQFSLVVYPECVLMKKRKEREKKIICQKEKISQTHK